MSEEDCSYLCLDFIKWSIRVAQGKSLGQCQRGCYKSDGIGRCPYLPDVFLDRLGKSAEDILKKRKSEAFIMDKIELILLIGNEVCEGCGPDWDCGFEVEDCFRIQNAIRHLDKHIESQSLPENIQEALNSNDERYKKRKELIEWFKLNFLRYKNYNGFLRGYIILIEEEMEFLNRSE